MLVSLHKPNPMQTFLIVNPNDIHLSLIYICTFLSLSISKSLNVTYSAALEVTDTGLVVGGLTNGQS